MSRTIPMLAYTLVWSVIVAACVLSATRVDAAPDMMKLTLALSSARYQPAEPIVLLVTVTNGGSDDFEDLAYLTPSAGHLILSLVGPSGAIPDTGPVDMVVYGHKGPTLHPHESWCAVLNVLSRFGERVGGEYGLPEMGRFRDLPPGNYQIRATLNARLGFARGLPPVVVESNSAAFEIVEERAVAEANSALLDLIGQRGDLGARRARAMQLVRGRGWERLYPGYVLLAALSGLSAPADMPTDELAANPNAFGFSTLQGAAFLDHRVGSLGGSLSEKREVLGGLEGRAHSQTIKMCSRYPEETDGGPSDRLRGAVGLTDATRHRRLLQVWQRGRKGALE